MGKQIPHQTIIRIIHQVEGVVSAVITEMVTIRVAALGIGIKAVGVINVIDGKQVVCTPGFDFSNQFFDKYQGLELAVKAAYGAVNRQAEESWLRAYWLLRTP